MKGLGLMAVSAGLSVLMIRWDGIWAIFAKTLLLGTMATLIVFGCIAFGMATFKKSAECQIRGCRELWIRYCDYRMGNNTTCGRQCCKNHIKTLGPRDLCQEHYEQEA